MKKRWVLLLIIAFPSFIWLLLETSNINSRKLPFYGRKVAQGGGDTLYHSVRDSVLETDCRTGIRLEKKTYPLYVAMIADRKYRKENYRLTGLIEYLQYKPEKIKHIPFVFISSCDGDSSSIADLKHLPQSPNLIFQAYPGSEYKKLIQEYFNQKPYYIDYSFLVLVDPNRHVRGFYDGRYVSEIKRLIEEYQHLRLKEEKQRLINSNEIKTNS